MAGEVTDEVEVRRETGVGEAAAAGELQEVALVQGAAQAFAVEHRVVAQFERSAAVGVDAGESVALAHAAPRS